MKNTPKTMKKTLFFFIATLLISGKIDAQENHYQYNYHLFEHSMPIVTQIKIDGVEQTSSDIELGSFNGDIVTGSERIGQYGSAGYYRAYMAVFFNEPYEVSFKIYNHSTGEEMDNCEITYLGEPYDLVLNDDGLGTNRKPLVLNFLTSSAPTFTKEIVGYGSNTGGYYLIASPIDDVNPEDVDGMIADNADDYDLYWFDQTENLEWINYKAGTFNMVSGMGYLYANKYDVTLTFTGTPIDGPTYEVSLVKDDEAEFPGWNLVGNPFAEHTAYIDRDCYVMNPEGRSEIIATNTRSIEPMEGAFVIATENDEPLTFSTEAPNNDGKGLVLSLRRSGVSTGSTTAVIDRAIIRFGEGRQLPKFQLRENSTKVYIPQGDKDYAVVNVCTDGACTVSTMDVNFKAEENGIYTLSFSSENMVLDYLHLIDNMANVETDLLANPNYSFEAKTTDCENRFKLVFCSNGIEENGPSTGSGTFVFYSNGCFVVNNEGKATLQVIDINGHVLKSESINGCGNVNINAAAGVYLFRLINGDIVKTQKVVIK